GVDQIVVPLRRISLVRSERGAFSLRDIELSQKPVEEGESAEGRPDPAAVEAAFREADSRALDELSASILRARRSIEAVDAAIADAAPGASTDLDRVAATLEKMGQVVGAQRAANAPLESGVNGGGGGMDAGGSGSGAAAGGGVRERQ